MALDLSALSAHTDQTSMRDLIVKQTVSPLTATLARKVTGVRNPRALNLLTSTATHQVGGTCGFSTSGTQTMSQRTLTASPIKINEQICLRDFEAYWADILIANGQDYTDKVIPQTIIENILKKDADQLEGYDWTGTVAGAAKYDGLATIITAAAGVTEANAAAYVEGGVALTAVDKTNVLKAIDAVINATVVNVPALIGKSNNYLFVPLEYYAYAVQAYLDKNYYGAFANTQKNGSETMMPIIGYPNFTIVGTKGLTGTKDMYLINGDNMFLGVDMDTEETNAKIWYSQDDDVHKIAILYRRGWQVAYPSEIVKFTIA